MGEAAGSAHTPTCGAVICPFLLLGTGGRGRFRAGSTRWRCSYRRRPRTRGGTATTRSNPARRSPIGRAAPAEGRRPAGARCSPPRPVEGADHPDRIDLDLEGEPVRSTRDEPRLALFTPGPCPRSGNRRVLGDHGDRAVRHGEVVAGHHRVDRVIDGVHGAGTDRNRRTPSPMDAPGGILGDGGKPGADVGGVAKPTPGIVRHRREMLEALEPDQQDDIARLGFPKPHGPGDREQRRMLTAHQFLDGSPIAVAGRQTQLGVAIPFHVLGSVGRGTRSCRLWGAVPRRGVHPAPAPRRRGLGCGRSGGAGSERGRNRTWHTS